MNIIEPKDKFVVTVGLEFEYTVKLRAHSAHMASEIAADYVQNHYKELTPDQEKPEISSAMALGDNNNA